MLIDINPNMEIPKFTLTLCKRNKQQICELGSAYGKTYTNYFAEIDEFAFTVPYYIQDAYNNNIVNPVYDLVKGGYMVLLGDYQYFIIEEVEERENDGKLTKQVHCYSREYELGEKKIRGYSFDARKLYTDPLDISQPTFDDDGNYWGVLNYIQTITTWRVDYINPDLLELYRGIDISDDNIIAIIQQLQVAFDCLFMFDTINKKFNIYTLDELGQNKGLYISDDNYVRSITKNVKQDEIKTRLYLYGKDNISIESLNITGQPYLQNISFYRTLEYMSQELIDALDAYDLFLATKEGDFTTLVGSLNTYSSDLATLNDELTVLNTQLKVLNQTKDIKITDGQSIEAINTEIGLKQIEISSKQSAIVSKQNDIDDVNADIVLLRTSIDTTQHFTTAELDELDPFIKDDTYADDAYIEENIQELFDYGVKTLGMISQPRYEFSVDSVNFLKIVECQFDWQKLVIGDIVNIKHDKLGINTAVRLINYTYDEDANSLDMNFTNKNSISDAGQYERELLEKLNRATSSVDFSKYNWNNATPTKTALETYINNELDLARQGIIQAVGQDPILDDRGLWLKKMYENGTYSPEQIRAVNNIIALTKDNWGTVAVAITPDGIVAENVYGILGQFVTVRANQIVVGDEGQTIDSDVLGDDIVKMDVDYVNGIRIDSADGVVVTRSDNKVRVIMNATNGISVQKWDSVNSVWVSNFYVDIDGNLKLTGSIESGSSITGATISGGTLNINDKFIVDGDGHMTSTDGSIIVIDEEKMARSVLTPDAFTMQTGDGTGVNWTDRFYFDAVKNKYVFDGELSADTINVSSALIARALSAGNANIGQLTVDQLSTQNKIAKYLNLDTSDVNYIRIQGQFIDWVTAHTDGEGTEHAVDREDNPLYWTTSSFEYTTIEETTWPVTQYVYTENIKTNFGFETISDNYVPAIRLGTGVGVGTRGQGFIYKDTTSMNVVYDKDDGTGTIGISLDNDGFHINGLSTQYIEYLRLYPNGFKIKLTGEDPNTYIFSFDEEGRPSEIIQNGANTAPITYYEEDLV